MTDYTLHLVARPDTTLAVLLSHLDSPENGPDDLRAIRGRVAQVMRAQGVPCVLHRRLAVILLPDGSLASLPTRDAIMVGSHAPAIRPHLPADLAHLRADADDDADLAEAASRFSLYAPADDGLAAACLRSSLGLFDAAPVPA